MADILNTEENYNPKLGLKNIYAKLIEIIAKVNTLWASLVAQPKVYKALLTQTGTDAPVATVLANTLSGVPVWSRSGIGQYRLTLAGEFVDDKVFGADLYDGVGVVFHPISDGSSIIGYYCLYAQLGANDYLTLDTYDETFAQVEFSALTGTSKISLPPIEVYP